MKYLPHERMHHAHEPNDLKNALSLDDTLFWGSLHLFRNAPDDEVRKIADDFFKRKIPPIIVAWRLADQQIAKSHASKGMSAHDRVMRIGKACGDVCESVLATEDDVLRGCHHDTYNRSIYKPKFKNGDPQQIHVQVRGEFLDIAAISRLVASAASFNIHRIYYDASVNGQEAELNSRLRSALEQALN